METGTVERRVGIVLVTQREVSEFYPSPRLAGSDRRLLSWRPPKSVCPERVRREPERRRRKFRPETLRHKNGRRRHAGAAGLLESGGSVSQSTHRRGAARRRLISQVTGQKGGRRRQAFVPMGSSAALYF